MRWLLLLFVLVACQVPADVASAVREGVTAGIVAVDRNGDGIVTNREIKDSKDDPTFWIAIGTGLLGMLGLLGSRKAQKDVDDLYDAKGPVT